MIEIQSVSALATVQDLGRFGGLRWGVGTSGAMDPMSLVAGNLLLGNDDGAAAVEMQVFPFQVVFHIDCDFALTGADTAAQLDGRPVLPWWRTTARAGQMLRVGMPQRGAWPAARAYLCVAGGIAVEPVLGSRSTQLRGAFGGHEGRALRQGDRLAVGRPGLGTAGAAHRGASGQARAGVEYAAAGGASPQDHAGLGLVPPALALPLQVDGLPAVRVIRASEYDRYTEASLASFWSQPWKITPQSDRYGYRLAGSPLEARAPMEMRSHGIVPGVIQVPPGGQPIVQMRDAQPSGGYPKIGTVIEADLWRLGQAPIGSHIRFVQASWPQAVAALEENRRWCDDARRLIALWHSRAGATGT